MFDRLVEQQTYLERLASFEAPRLSAPFVDAARRVTSITETLLHELSGRGLSDEPWTTVRYAEHVDRLSAAYRAAAASLKEGASEVILSVAKLEAEWQAKILFEALPIHVDFSRPPLEQLRSLIRAPIDGRQLADWTQGLSRQADATAREVIQRGLMRGTPVGPLTAEIRGELGRSAAHAETIVRTAISHASSGARELFAAENTDVIVGVRWVSVLDSRTSFECAALSGRVFRIGEGPRPPAHPRCRSTTELLTRSSEELLSGRRDEVTQDYLDAASRRATRGGTVPGADTRSETIRQYPAATKYGTWLRDQPAVTQDRVLGRERARLFRSGKVPIEGFVGADYRPLTLDEIADRWDLPRK